MEGPSGWRRPCAVRKLREQHRNWNAVPSQSSRLDGSGTRKLAVSSKVPGTSKTVARTRPRSREETGCADRDVILIGMATSLPRENPGTPEGAAGAVSRALRAARRSPADGSQEREPAPARRRSLGNMAHKM